MSSPHTVCVYKQVNDCSIKCDVYPGNSGAPVVVYIHGGALIFGSRADLPKPTIAPFKKVGYWVISIDYRLAPETQLPDIINDVRDALDWVRGAGAKQFGYDPDKLIIIGGSAGGYLTLMTGTFERKPKVLVPLYGYGDLLGDWYRKPSPHYLKQPLISPEEAQNAMWDTPRSEARMPDRWAIYLRARQLGTWTSLVSGLDINTQRRLVEKFCPIRNITDDFPPTILLHGDQDSDVPYEQSLDMYNALRKRGVTTELLTYAGGEHAFDYNLDDHNVPGLIDKALQFVQMHL